MIDALRWIAVFVVLLLQTRILVSLRLAFFANFEGVYFMETTLKKANLL